MESSAGNEQGKIVIPSFLDFDPYAEHFRLSVRLVGKPAEVEHMFVD